MPSGSSRASTEIRPTGWAVTTVNRSSSATLWTCFGAAQVDANCWSAVTATRQTSPPTDRATYRLAIEPASTRRNDVWTSSDPVGIAGRSMASGRCCSNVSTPVLAGGSGGDGHAGAGGGSGGKGRGAAGGVVGSGPEDALEELAKPARKATTASTPTAPTAHAG